MTAFDMKNPVDLHIPLVTILPTLASMLGTIIEIESSGGALFIDSLLVWLDDDCSAILKGRLCEY